MRVTPVEGLFGLAPDGVYHRHRLLPAARCALTAPFHPYLCPQTEIWEGHRRSTLCCTFRRLAPPRRYLASYPMEPGLSSTLPKKNSDCPANSRHRVMMKPLPGNHSFSMAHWYSVFFRTPVISLASLAACFTGSSCRSISMIRIDSGSSPSSPGSGAPRTNSTISPRC